MKAGRAVSRLSAWAALVAACGICAAGTWDPVLEGGPLSVLDSLEAVLPLDSLVAVPTGSPPVAWRRSFTPPMPVEWPLRDGTLFAYYCFESGTGGGLYDAEFVTDPFAMIMVTAEGCTAVWSLAAPPGPAGIRGVRPFRPGILDPLACGDSVGLLLRGLRQCQMDSTRIREFYVAWCSLNPGAASFAGQRHPAFFEWLGCPVAAQ